MPFALTAPNVEDEAALLNFEQIAKVLGGGSASAVLRGDANGNAGWGQRVLYGNVASGGTVAQAGSGGWTVALGAAGFYTITFTTAFTSLPSVTATVGPGGLTLIAVINTLAVGSTQLIVVTPAGAGTNSAFSFTATGI